MGLPEQSRRVRTPQRVGRPPEGPIPNPGLQHQCTCLDSGALELVALDKVWKGKRTNRNSWRQAGLAAREMCGGRPIAYEPTDTGTSVLVPLWGSIGDSASSALSEGESESMGSWRTFGLVWDWLGSFSGSTDTHRGRGHIAKSKTVEIVQIRQ
ncbi:hypothetical protein C8Q70DRAFT_935088 [Cubamyces menziesii]|nr:hypothetical protein C8Q70DRAFT_935088 [Cubamyces menziesii]